MKLVEILRKSAKTLALVGTLAATSCGNEKLIVDPLNPRIRDEIVGRLIETDQEYEPELEKEIEREFDVNILGNPKYLTEELLIVNAFKYGSSLDPDWESKPTQIQASWVREYRNTEGSRTALIILASYNALLDPEGSLKTEKYSPEINVNYPTEPVDNSNLIREFRETMESPQWLNEYKMLADN